MKAFRQFYFLDSVCTYNNKYNRLVCLAPFPTFVCTHGSKCHLVLTSTAPDQSLTHRRVLTHQHINLKGNRSISYSFFSPSFFLLEFDTLMHISFGKKRSWASCIILNTKLYRLSPLKFPLTGYPVYSDCEQGWQKPEAEHEQNAECMYVMQIGFVLWLHAFAWGACHYVHDVIILSYSSVTALYSLLAYPMLSFLHSFSFWSVYTSSVNSKYQSSAPVCKREWARTKR